MTAPDVRRLVTIPMTTGCHLPLARISAGRATPARLSDYILRFGLFPAFFIAIAVAACFLALAPFFFMPPPGFIFP